MSLVSRLARELQRTHADRAAVVLERAGLDSAVQVLKQTGAEVGAVVRRMSPQFGAAVLERLEPRQATAVIESLPLDIAARLLRRLDSGSRTVLDNLKERRARALQSLLRFPENTAGDLMDPEVLALPEDLTAREALAQVRRMSDFARYNLYVVDRDQILVGALNLRELLLARSSSRLSAVMHRQPLVLAALAGLTDVVSHPGWREVHSLPVVDEHGRYLGAVRYRTLRMLEERLRGGAFADGNPAEALGQLLAAGAAGVLEAMTPPASGRSRSR